MPQPRLYPSHAARQRAYRKRQEEARQKEREARGLPPLPAIATMPGNVRWQQAISQAAGLLTMVVGEMEAYFDERSEEWQESDRAEVHQERIGSVQETVDALQAVWA